jgi:hypothetical protein
MRKLMLISALLLVSASAQAAESRGLVLAASDTTVASGADNLPRPLPPVAKNDTKNDTKSDAKDDTKSDMEQPRQHQANESAAPRTRPHAQPRRYEANEATARRIAARYGISW